MVRPRSACSSRPTATMASAVPPIAAHAIAHQPTMMPNTCTAVTSSAVPTAARPMTGDRLPPLLQRLGLLAERPRCRAGPRRTARRPADPRTAGCAARREPTGCPGSAPAEGPVAAGAAAGGRTTRCRLGVENAGGREVAAAAGRPENVVEPPKPVGPVRAATRPRCCRGCPRRRASRTGWSRRPPAVAARRRGLLRRLVLRAMLQPHGPPHQRRTGGPGRGSRGRCGSRAPSWPVGHSFAAQRLAGVVHPLLPVAARAERAAALLAGDMEGDERDDGERPERQTPGQRRRDADDHQQRQPDGQDRRDRRTTAADQRFARRHVVAVRRQQQPEQAVGQHTDAAEDGECDEADPEQDRVDAQVAAKAAGDAGDLRVGAGAAGSPRPPVVPGAGGAIRLMPRFRSCHHSARIGVRRPSGTTLISPNQGAPRFARRANRWDYREVIEIRRKPARGTGRRSAAVGLRSRLCRRRPTKSTSSSGSRRYRRPPRPGPASRRPPAATPGSLRDPAGPSPARPQARHPGPRASTAPSPNSRCSGRSTSRRAADRPPAVDRPTTSRRTPAGPRRQPVHRAGATRAAGPQRPAHSAAQPGPRRPDHRWRQRRDRRPSPGAGDLGPAGVLPARPAVRGRCRRLTRCSGSASRRPRRPGAPPEPSRTERRQAIGIAALGAALAVVGAAFGFGTSIGWIIGPLGLAAVGGAFIWREADDARRQKLAPVRRRGGRRRQRRALAGDRRRDAGGRRARRVRARPVRLLRDRRGAAGRGADPDRRRRSS